MTICLVNRRRLLRVEATLLVGVACIEEASSQVCATPGCTGQESLSAMRLTCFLSFLSLGAEEFFLQETYFFRATITIRTPGVLFLCLAGGNTLRSNFHTNEGRNFGTMRKHVFQFRISYDDSMNFMLVGTKSPLKRSWRTTSVLYPFREGEDSRNSSGHGANSKYCESGAL